MKIVEFRHDIGDSVKVLPVEMSGRVDALMRDTDGIQYRVIYWNDGQRYSQWVYDWEIKGGRDAGM